MTSPWQSFSPYLPPRPPDSSFHTSSTPYRYYPEIMNTSSGRQQKILRSRIEYHIFQYTYRKGHPRQFQRLPNFVTSESMGPPSADLLNDRFFKFVIGKAKKVFTVHADVFARLSKPLNTPINGPVAEATKEAAIWYNICEETFNRLTQFAYCGDYDCATPKPRSLPNVPKARDNRNDHDDTNEADHESARQPNFHPNGPPSPFRWTLPYSIRKIHRDIVQHQTHTRTITRVRQYEDISRSAEFDSRLSMINEITAWDEANGFNRFEHKVKMDKIDDGSCTNLRERFICHVDLHILADKYCFDSLAVLTTAKLAKLIRSVTIFPESVGEIASLIRYVFEHTVRLDLIQDVLIYFGAAIIKDVCEDPEFAQMLLDVPEFALGVIQKVARYRILKD